MLLSLPLGWSRRKTAVAFLSLLQFQLPASSQAFASAFQSKSKGSPTKNYLQMTSSSVSSSTKGKIEIAPPVARREEDRVVYAGVAPPGWDPKIPRKEEGAEYPLMDPPVPVPDPYGWMRDDKRENKEVLEHLEKENEYTMRVVEHLEPLREKIYDELVASIQETDYTTPRPGFNQEYVYYSRTFEGKSYSQHVRAPSSSMVSAEAITWDGSKDTPVLAGEEVLLDVNELAEGKKYCSTGAVKTSPSQTQLAYSVDFTGGETYGVWIKNLESGQVQDLKLETSGNLVWGKDDSTLFYMTMDDKHRPDKLYRRRLDQPDSTDEMLHEESDDMYYPYIFKSLDGKYLFMKAASKETSEVWFLDLEDPNGKMQCVAPRRNKVLYSVNHRHGSWWISTNVDGSPNMKLMTCDAKADSASDWKLVTTADGKPLFDGGFEPSLGSVSVFDSHVVMSGREDSIPRVWVYDPASQELERLEFDEPAHDVGLSSNSVFHTDSIAITFDSMVTPPQTMLVSLAAPNGERTVLKAKNVPKYQKELYACDRTTVLSRDGKAEIPVSLVYRKDVMEQCSKDGKTLPVHRKFELITIPSRCCDYDNTFHTLRLPPCSFEQPVYGYGSYGSSIEADFRSSRLPLLNRGYVYAIAHVRGGGEKVRSNAQQAHSVNSTNANPLKFLPHVQTFTLFRDAHGTRLQLVPSLTAKRIPLMISWTLLGG